MMVLGFSDQQESCVVYLSVCVAYQRPHASYVLLSESEEVCPSWPVLSQQLTE